MLPFVRAVTIVGSSIFLVSCAAQSSLTNVVANPEAGSDLVSLIDDISLDYDVFKLDNGLTVLVNENRKAPIVSVGVWYNVGSKDEPAGKTGFAHLFEHLMFNGSENLDDDYFVFLEQIGATNYNGTTSYDRTNYYETVPTGGLERALFMESDRMGYFLGAVTQDKLDNQRGVVQNEKRQNDNKPGGLVFDEVTRVLFPEGHPYHHTTIGSMADLDAASLGDVQQWFEDKYSPNNAVLVLSGDISTAEARPLIEKYFGSIDRGAANVPAVAPVPTLAKPVRLEFKDRIAAVDFSKMWAVPGRLDDDAEALDMAGVIIGGLASSRLDNELVRGDEIATRVSASYQPFHRVGLFSVNVTIKPGQDKALIERRVDEILAEFVTEGPTEAEMNRAKTRSVSGTVRAMEAVSTAGSHLAQGQLFEEAPEEFLRSLKDTASLTSEQVRVAASKWLSRPAVTILLKPGERPPYVEAGGQKNVSRDAGKTYQITNREVPDIGTTRPLDFPDVQHGHLSNGIELHYAQRSDVPLTQVVMRFDAGTAADPPGSNGLSSMVMSLLNEGAGALNAQAIAEAQEDLGSSIGFGIGRDDSSASMTALSVRFEPTLDLFRTLVREPSFNEEAVERVRAQRLSQIEQAKTQPNGMIGQVLLPIIYGERHPYASNGMGTKVSVSSIAREDLRRFQSAFLRPEKAEFFVVSDLPFEEIQTALNARFGTWTVGSPAGEKRFTPLPQRPKSPRILLIDRPQSPQSTIVASQLLPLDPRAELVDLFSANEALGGSFLSRLNADLRETKGWSYGVNGSIGQYQESLEYSISAPVQADKTADSILALNEQLDQFLGPKGITQGELDRIVTNNIAQLPGQFEKGGAVLMAMLRNDSLGRPDNYYETLADLYRAQTREVLDRTMRDALDPQAFTWVIVGDALIVSPQLEKAGLPYELVDME